MDDLWCAASSEAQLRKLTAASTPFTLVEKLQKQLTSDMKESALGQLLATCEPYQRAIVGGLSGGAQSGAWLLALPHERA